LGPSVAQAGKARRCGVARAAGIGLVGSLGSRGGLSGQDVDPVEIRAIGARGPSVPMIERATFNLSSYKRFCAPSVSERSCPGWDGRVAARRSKSLCPCRRVEGAPYLSSALSIWLRRKIIRSPVLTCAERFA
jgi:hypothetical protein